MHQQGRTGLRDYHQVRATLPKHCTAIAHDKKQEAIRMTKQQRKILIKIIIGAVLFAVGMVVTHLLTLRGGRNC